jgi:fluoride exporter
VSLPGINSVVAVFLGGAIGSIARYGVGFGLTSSGLSTSYVELSLTMIVNLSGALFLGFVNSASFFSVGNRRAFFGTGLAGGFTTMSGVALITAGNDLGLGPDALLYWLLVILQFVLGYFAYALGNKILGSVK